ncbi:BTB/POZ domain-containing protein NPY1-like isoform X2 [Andrographis paniculata]|nr:BTB/POZ domain-containing protein NPY1-like isoform X2 [Andrographis paniculata]
MKFMKLGSKRDSFQSEGSSVRYALSELATDVVVNVAGVRFHLHKFPLLSKSLRLKKLVSDEASDVEIQLSEFPGGAKAFEICAKFCYGIAVTLNAYNVAAARCAAEYLEMIEDVDRGNLVLKVEIFLNSSILRSWKDSIIVLQSTRSLLPWSEDLRIVGRCIDSIASKTSVDPSMVNWSYTYNRKASSSSSEIRSSEKIEHVPDDWWIDDICELDVDLFKRVMIAIKSKGRMNGGAIGEALRTYAIRWIPNSVDALVSDANVVRHKCLVETIIRLLPSDKGAGCSCSFLLKLLKVAILIGAEDSSREDLTRSIGSKLDEASVNDLLIPSQPTQATLYDIELVRRLVRQFVESETSSRDSKIVAANDFVLGHGSWLKVGKLIDVYLASVAHDPNLTVSDFVALSDSIPDAARPIHDGLYGAIDAYLKEHKNITKSEKKTLCVLIDVKKLTTEMSMHAAQNEQLPLRTVVQVLFFEQVKAVVSGRASNVSPDENRRRMAADSAGKSLRKQMDELKVKEEAVKNGKVAKRGSSAQLLPSRSKRIFDKLWKGFGSAENKSKSSETSGSGSSQSPVSTIRGEGKMMAASSSRNRRHSIS